MADTTDTPTSTDAETPATPRRRASRKTGATAKPATTRRTASRKSVATKAEEAVAGAATGVATRAKRGGGKAEDAVVSVAKAVKPRSSSRGKPRAAAAKKPGASRGKSKAGGKWGVAAIAGGLAAAGAAAAALLSLKGSSKDSVGTTPHQGAHQPDGTDSSKSFEANIADENTVPN